jgi:hypothetical protein
MSWTLHVGLLQKAPRSIHLVTYLNLVEFIWIKQIVPFSRKYFVGTQHYTYDPFISVTSCAYVVFGNLHSVLLNCCPLLPHPVCSHPMSNRWCHFVGLHSELPHSIIFIQFCQSQDNRCMFESTGFNFNPWIFIRRLWLLCFIHFQLVVQMLNNIS